MSLIIAAASMKILPDEIPMHYNLKGVADRMGSKYEMFLYPVVVGAMALLWQLIINHYSKKLKSAEDEKTAAELKNNIKVLQITSVVIMLMEIIMQLIGTYNAFRYTEAEALKMPGGISTASGAIIGIVLAVLGNIMPKAKRNAVFGLRTPWSMENDRTWSESNRFGGVMLFVSGILITAGAFLLKSEMILIFMMIILLAAVIASVIYSYFAYLKYKD